MLIRRVLDWFCEIHSVRLLNWLMFKCDSVSSHPRLAASSSCPTLMSAFPVIGSVTWPVPVATAQSAWRSWCWRQQRCTAWPRGSVATRVNSGVSAATEAQWTISNITHWHRRHYGPRTNLQITVIVMLQCLFVPLLYFNISSLIGASIASCSVFMQDMSVMGWKISLVTRGISVIYYWAFVLHWQQQMDTVHVHKPQVLC